MTWFLRGGRNILGFSVQIEINSVLCGGLEIGWILEWRSKWLDFCSGVEINLIFVWGIEFDLVLVLGSNVACLRAGDRN